MTNKKTKTSHGRLVLTLAILILSFTATSSQAVQIGCEIEVAKVLVNAREGEVGVRAHILDSDGNVIAAKIWHLCKTEISDDLRATLSTDVSDWTSEEDCTNVLKVLLLAKALDQNVSIVFRNAPDQQDPTVAALACEDVKAFDSVLFEHLHQVALID